MKTGLKMAALALVLALLLGFGMTPVASAMGPYYSGWGYSPYYVSYGWAGYYPYYAGTGYYWWSNYGYTCYPPLFTAWSGHPYPYPYWGDYRYGWR